MLCSRPAAPAGLEGPDWADVFPVRGGSGAAGTSMSTPGRFQDPMGYSLEIPSLITALSRGWNRWPPEILPNPAQDREHPPSCLHYPPVTPPGCFRHLAVWLWNSSIRNDVEENESHCQQGSNHCSSPSQPITQAANTSCKHFSWTTVFIPQLPQRPTYKS